MEDPGERALRLLKQRIADEEKRREILDAEFENAKRLGWLSPEGPPKPIAPPTAKPEDGKIVVIDIKPIE